jgi:prepilin-type N-terminal cleavage/methylation domain-containing protein
MKTEFQAKFIQNLVSKKKNNEGFTLIELLVVIIIVGVLAAIALPSFLNQIGKARGSEAKSNIGTINRSQQAFRLENNTMASEIAVLDAKITGKFYTYAIDAATVTDSFATVSGTTEQADLKAYSGGVSQRVTAGQETFAQVVCESDQNVAQGDAVIVPTVANLDAVIDTPDDATDDCDATYKKID